jgi:hypothetical protein
MGKEAVKISLNNYLNQQHSQNGDFKQAIQTQTLKATNTVT